jgi:transcriptional regulator with XRE-family HTH domain
MKTIIQKELSSRLQLDPPFFNKILSGKKKPTAPVAARLEQLTGIGIRTWLFGKPEEIKRELEKIYGKINFKRGRLPGKKQVNP